MNKKIIAAVLAGSMCAAMLAGCGGNSESGSAAQDTAGSTELRQRMQADPATRSS